MGNIAAFLQPPVMGEEKKVWISRRFKGEDGMVATHKTVSTNKLK